MKKNDCSFDDWFDHLQMNLADRGINFRNPNAVRQDYDEGRDMHDVADEIEAEHTE